MKNFVNPKVADSIRIQLIRETFADKITAYCMAKDKYKSDLKEASDKLIKEFEDYMKSIYPKQYRQLKEVMGKIDDGELKAIPLEGVLEGINISHLSIRLFKIKDMLPKKGRLYYQLLPQDTKQQIDKLVEDLKQSVPYIQQLSFEYGEAKSKLAMLYDTDPENINIHKNKAIDEMDKIIANKLLSAIKIILSKEREVSMIEYTEDQKTYYTEQMVYEILIMLEQNITDLSLDYDDKDQAVSTELSKQARKELYLKNRDKGMEK